MYVQIPKYICICLHIAISLQEESTSNDDFLHKAKCMVKYYLKDELMLSMYPSTYFQPINHSSIVQR